MSRELYTRSPRKEVSTSSGIVDGRRASGLRVYNRLYPEHKITIIIQGNLDYTDPVSLANALERMLFGKK